MRKLSFAELWFQTPWPSFSFLLACALLSLQWIFPSIRSITLPFIGCLYIQQSRCIVQLLHFQPCATTTTWHGLDNCRQNKNPWQSCGLTSPDGSSSIFVRTCSPSSAVKKCEPTSDASVVMTFADEMTLPSLSVNVMWPSFDWLKRIFTLRQKKIQPDGINFPSTGNR